MLRMAYSIRTKCYLEDNQVANDSDYIKQLYIKNRNWNPLPAPNIIEESLITCEKLLKQEHETRLNKNKTRNLSNLTPIQSKALLDLKLNHKIIIKPMDKNLGPAAMDLDHYIQQILKEHLMTNDYTQLSKNSAKDKMELIRSNLKGMLTQNQYQLTKAGHNNPLESVMCRPDGSIHS